MVTSIRLQMFQIIVVIVNLIVIGNVVNCDNITVAELRKSVQAEDQTQFDPIDVERLKTDDTFIYQFIDETNGDPKKAKEWLTDSLKWRKEFGINQLTDTSFPQEFYKMGGIFLYGEDRNGTQLLVIRVRLNAVNSRKLSPKIGELLRKFFAYQFEKVGLAKKQLALLFDCTGMSLDNVDMNFLKFLVFKIKKSYPRLVPSAVVNALPDFVQVIAKLVISWLSGRDAQLLHFVKRYELDQYIARDQLPDFLDGTNKKPYRTAPNGAPTLQELAKKLALDDEEIKTDLGHFEPLIKG